MIAMDCAVFSSTISAMSSEPRSPKARGVLAQPNSSLSMSSTSASYDAYSVRMSSWALVIASPSRCNRASLVRAASPHARSEVAVPLVTSKKGLAAWERQSPRSVSA